MESAPTVEEPETATAAGVRRGCPHVGATQKSRQKPYCTTSAITSLNENGNSLQEANDCDISSFTSSESFVRVRRRLSKSWFKEHQSKLAEFVKQNEDDESASNLVQIREVLKSISEAVSVDTCDSYMIEEVTRLAQMGSKEKQAVRESGGLAVVIHAMASKINDEKVQAAGCALLESISEDVEEVQEALGNCEGIDAILDTMLAHPENEKLQEVASSALMVLTFSDHNKKLVMRSGAQEDLIRTMLMYSEHAGIQHRIVATLGHIVFGSPAARKRCGQVGGVKAVLDAMQRFPDDVTVQGHGSLALRNFSWACPENNAIMHENGATCILLRTLKRHSRVPGVQDQGLSCMSHLLFDKLPNSQQALKENALDVVEACFQALKIFPGHESVVHSAMRVLFNIVQTSCETKDTLIVASYPNAASILCGAVGTDLQRCIPNVVSLVKLVRVLCHIANFQVMFQESDGIGILLSCLEQFSRESPPTGHLILDGLISACSGRDESKIQFSEICGVSVLSVLMEDMSNDEVFLEKSVRLLDNISNGQFEVTAEKMADRHIAVQAILQAMKSYPESIEVQEHGCSAMIKICETSTKDVDDLCSLGARPVVERARQLHHESHAMGVAANQLLQLLVPKGESSGSHGVTHRGKASSRLRSRSRTVQTGQRSRSRMTRSKSREKFRVAQSLRAVAEEPYNFSPDSDSSSTQYPSGAKPKKVTQKNPDGTMQKRRGTLQTFVE